MDVEKYYADMLRKAQRKLRSVTTKARNYKQKQFSDYYGETLDAEVNRAVADVRKWEERLAKVTK